jgi:hypothetical protein
MKYVMKALSFHVLGVCPTVPKLCPSRSKISKYFQIKPKVDHINPLNSSALKYRVFDVFFTGTENPRVGSSILSLGTQKNQGVIISRELIEKKLISIEFPLRRLKIPVSAVRFCPSALKKIKVL